MSTNRSGPGRLAAIALSAVTAAAGILVAATPAYAAGAPTITAISVAKGSTAGGTGVLITGTNFDTVADTTSTNVQFGSADAANFIVISATQIAAKAPAGTGAVYIKVTNPSGNSGTSTAAAKFTYREPLTAVVAANTLLNPVTGSNIDVDVTGLTLASTTFAAEAITATVGGAAAVVKYKDTDTVTVTAPAGTPSNTAVAVALIHDTIPGTNDTTHVKYASVISSLSSTSGPKAGTTGSSSAPALTITGKGLTGATSFLLGGEALTCTVTNDTTVKCDSIVPQDTPIVGPFLITYTTATGPRGTTSGAVYTFTDVS